MTIPMDNPTLLLLPVISALIAWFTNWIAIKMLFHPRRPVNILGMKIQGIFPKRQQQIATKLGSIVAKELLHFDEIAVRLRDPQQLSVVRPDIEQHLDHFLQEKLKEKLPVIAMFIGQGTIGKIKEGLMEEIDLLLPQVIEKYTSSLSDQIDVEKIVAEKISNFSSDKLEEILVSILSKEFRFIELIGGLIGFMIGLLQLLLVHFF